MKISVLNNKTKYFPHDFYTVAQLNSVSVFSMCSLFRSNYMS